MTTDNTEWLISNTTPLNQSSMSMGEKLTKISDVAGHADVDLLAFALKVGAQSIGAATGPGVLINAPPAELGIVGSQRKTGLAKPIESIISVDLALQQSGHIYTNQDESTGLIVSVEALYWRDQAFSNMTADEAWVMDDSLLDDKYAVYPAIKARDVAILTLMKPAGNAAFDRKIFLEHLTKVNVVDSVYGHSDASTVINRPLTGVDFGLNVGFFGNDTEVSAAVGEIEEQPTYLEQTPTDERNDTGIGGTSWTKDDILHSGAGYWVTPMQTATSQGAEDDTRGHYDMQLNANGYDQPAVNTPVDDLKYKKNKFVEGDDTYLGANINLVKTHLSSFGFIINEGEGATVSGIHGLHYQVHDGSDDGYGGLYWNFFEYWINGESDSGNYTAISGFIKQCLGDAASTTPYTFNDGWQYDGQSIKDTLTAALVAGGNNDGDAWWWTLGAYSIKISFDDSDLSDHTVSYSDFCTYADDHLQPDNSNGDVFHNNLRPLTSSHSSYVNAQVSGGAATWEMHHGLMFPDSQHIHDSDNSLNSLTGKVDKLYYSLSSTPYLTTRETSPDYYLLGVYQSDMFRVDSSAAPTVIQDSGKGYMNCFSYTTGYGFVMKNDDSGTFPVDNNKFLGGEGLSDVGDYSAYGDNEVAAEVLVCEYIRWKIAVAYGLDIFTYWKQGTQEADFVDNPHAAAGHLDYHGYNGDTIDQEREDDEGELVSIWDTGYYFGGEAWLKGNSAGTAPALADVFNFAVTKELLENYMRVLIEQITYETSEPLEQLLLALRKYGLWCKYLMRYNKTSLNEIVTDNRAETESLLRLKSRGYEFIESTPQPELVWSSKITNSQFWWSGATSPATTRDVGAHVAGRSFIISLLPDYWYRAFKHFILRQYKFITFSEYAPTVDWNSDQITVDARAPESLQLGYTKAVKFIQSGMHWSSQSGILGSNSSWLVDLVPPITPTLISAGGQSGLWRAGMSDETDLFASNGAGGPEFAEFSYYYAGTTESIGGIDISIAKKTSFEDIYKPTSTLYMDGHMHTSGMITAGHRIKIGTKEGEELAPNRIVFQCHGVAQFSGALVTSVPKLASDIATIKEILVDSDIRLKTNVNTIGSALDKINKMRGVEWNWIKNENRTTGVIAQEIMKIDRDLVTNTDNSLGVNYNALSGYFIEAIKEQQVLILAQGSEIQKLNDKMVKILNNTSKICWSKTELNSMKIQSLRTMLEEKGLDTTGLKRDLIQRLLSV